MFSRDHVQGFGGAEEELFSSRYPEYVHKIPATGATLSMDNAIPYIFQVTYTNIYEDTHSGARPQYPAIYWVIQICQTTHECRSYGLAPTFDVINAVCVHRFSRLQCGGATHC